MERSAGRTTASIPGGRGWIGADGVDDLDTADDDACPAVSVVVDEPDDSLNFSACCKTDWARSNFRNRSGFRSIGDQSLADDVCDKIECLLAWLLFAILVLKST